MKASLTDTLIMMGCMIVIWLAVWGVYLWRQRRRPVVSPRRQKRHARRVAMFYSLPFCLFGLAMQMLFQPNTAGTFALAGVVLLVVLSLLFKSADTFTPREAMLNYVKDPGHCGQCEYDLTGNVSGICPECGWEIPRQIPPEFHDYVPWPIWWKRWEIRHVENWRKALLYTVISVLFLAGFSAAMALALGPAAAVPPGIVCLISLVNIGRLIAYGRREARV